jgi:UDP-glucose 4-epimerase
MRATVGADVRQTYEPGRAFDVLRVVLDISKAREAIGWAPRTPLGLGIGET